MPGGFRPRLIRGRRFAAWDAPPGLVAASLRSAEFGRAAHAALARAPPASITDGEDAVGTSRAPARGTSSPIVGGFRASAQRTSSPIFGGFRAPARRTSSPIASARQTSSPIVGGFRAPTRRTSSPIMGLITERRSAARVAPPGLQSFFVCVPGVHAAGAALHPRLIRGRPFGARAAPFGSLLRRLASLGGIRSRR